MKTLFLLAITAAFAALSGCSPEPDTVADNQSAYQLAIEPCMTTDQQGVYVAPYVIIGPIDSNGTVVKIIATKDTQYSNWAYTLTARNLVPPNYTEDSSSSCWDRFPSQITEEWVTGPFTPPGVSGYYRGKYLLALQVDLFGYGGAVNNYPWNPSPWVVYKAKIWTSGTWVEHSWTLYATDVYHWIQNY